MPTGYTADVVSGKVEDFKTFALLCARAFGALITMRDDPMDAQIPDEFRPEPYYAEKLQDAKAHLLQLQNMTEDEVKVAHQTDYEEKVTNREKYRNEQQLQNCRLDYMIDKVLQWTPPSANHVEMKSFMLEQLRISKHDMDSFDRYYEIKETTPKEWYNEQIEKAHESVGYYAGEVAKEIERCAGRTLWVKQLRDSLK